MGPGGRGTWSRTCSNLVREMTDIRIFFAADSLVTFPCRLLLPSSQAQRSPADGPTPLTTTGQATYPCLGVADLTPCSPERNADAAHLVVASSACLLLLPPCLSEVSLLTKNSPDSAILDVGADTLVAVPSVVNVGRRLPFYQVLNPVIYKSSSTELWPCTPVKKEKEHVPEKSPPPAGPLLHRFGDRKSPVTEQRATP